MADKIPKIYVGNGKKNEKYDMINFSICLEDFQQGGKAFEHINASEKNGKHYINLTMSGNYEGKIDDYGNTHNITVNTWKKDQESNAAPVTTYDEGPAPDDSLPFSYFRNSLI